jgi:hypothetical protein
MRRNTVLVASALLILGLGVRLYCLWAFDLRDTPGAAGVLTISRVANGEAYREWPAVFISWILPAVDGDILFASQFLSIVMGVFAVTGAGLAGWSLAGKGGGLAAAFLASCWSMAILLSLLTGSDPTVFGVSWLGIGFAWAGTRAGGKLLFLVLLGAFFCTFSICIKETALPCIVLLAISPLLADSPKRGLGSAVLALSGVYATSGYLPSNLHRLQSPAPISLSTLFSGWEYLLEMYRRSMMEGLYIELLLIAAVSCLLPGKRRRQRFLVLFFSAAVLLYTAASLELRARPRHLAPLAIGIFALVGSGLQMLPKALPKLGRYAHLPSIGLVAVLLLDTSAFLKSWGQMHSYVGGGAPISWPSIPSPWEKKYENPSDISHRDLTAYGAIELTSIVSNEKNGVAIPPLRDSRHLHLVAAASIHGKRYLVLDKQACCTEEDAQCAKRLTAEIHAAGMTLILPTETNGIQRVDLVNQKWLTSLVHEVKLAESQESDWWHMRDGAQAVGPVPCIGAKLRRDWGTRR